MLIIIKKTKLIFIMVSIMFICILGYISTNNNYISTFTNEKYSLIIDNVFKIRNKALLETKVNVLDDLYDKQSKYGVWAYEHELRKMKYLHKWSEKQGVKFTKIKTKIKIGNVKESEESITANFIASTEYYYVYKDSPLKENVFRIGTYHTLRLNKNDDWYTIAKEWYTDPFADSLNLDNIKSEEIKNYIGLQTKAKININERRQKAIEYADRYCGGASDEEYGLRYNDKYINFNPLGGDCANFASQILFEGGKFRKTAEWNYDKTGSKSWVNAEAFKNYMLNSNRASLIAHGDYNSVYRASFKLLPGDFVAYEKKGKVTHISVIAGADSKGYTNVNCHNSDRYRVPWDLGWSDKGIKFWLVRVHY